jgi:hypothetical protein
VLFFPSFGIGNQRGLWRHCMLLPMKLGFLQRGYICLYHLDLNVAVSVIVLVISVFWVLINVGG